LAHYNTHQNYYGHQKYPPQQSATFLLFFLLFFASNLPIKPLEQVKALKADGSIKAWGALGFGTIGVPDGKGYTNIYSNTATFAALKGRQRLYWLNKSWYSHYHWVHLCPHNLSDPTP
jgi:hypothetical protein